MLNADENKPVAKSGQRNRKSAEQGGKVRGRNRKSDQVRDAKPDEAQEAAHAQVSEPIAATETTPAESAAREPAVTGSEQTESEQSTAVHTDIPPVVLNPPAEAVPVNIQTIANAYGDYTKKSLEQTRSFFERLAEVRSLDKAFELQTAFVKQAYETYVADSQKIRELHRELARQRLAGFEGFVARMTQTPFGLQSGTSGGIASS
ncbi:phasin family protein [Bradyrhizobium sp. ARR65]|uniref:phasin family protein n=1 Tax=Bradyrhizobium sp. ARR65 TaxID=1040989 RepID=UPI0004674F3E|nr:phasin family protein [Bradyrhizobium sp. ARR65]